jgi:hypothetical protein
MFKQDQNSGISRTHLHHEIQSNMIVIHRVDRRTDTCKPVEFDPLDELHPYSWDYTSALHLSAYEFGTRSRLKIPQDPISEL